MSASPMERVCIVMMSAVGDVVHVLPVINAIKRSKPATHITWVLQPAPSTLVKNHRSVDEVILFERKKGIAAMREVIGALRERKFDLLIDLQVYFKAGLISALSGAPRRLGFDRARARDANWIFTNERIRAHPVQHVQDQYFEFLRHLGIDPEPVEWCLSPTPEERKWQEEFVAQFDRPIASIVVATSKAEKDWIPERWAKVCDILLEKHGLQPVLVGGDTRREREAAEKIIASSKARPFSALGSGLRKLVSILDASEVVLAPDTGPLHISVALGRPVISLIGYTDPRRTGPYRHYHDLIIDAFHDAGDAGPITMATKQGRMQRITVEDVAKKLDVWSADYRGKS